MWYVLYKSNVVGAYKTEKAAVIAAKRYLDEDAREVVVAKAVGTMKAKIETEFVRAQE